MELYDAYTMFLLSLLPIANLLYISASQTNSFQWHSLQVPIVASTGGLVDTVKEGFTGFQMGSFNVEVITHILSHAS